MWGSNPRPSIDKIDALPAELTVPIFGLATALFFVFEFRLQQSR